MLEGKKVEKLYLIQYISLKDSRFQGQQYWHNCKIDIFEKMNDRYMM